MKVCMIRDGLYTRGQALNTRRDEKIWTLRQLGITMVISLWKPDPDLQGLKGVAYLHSPQPDSARFDWPAAHDLAIRAYAQIVGGGSVLIQCHAGRNRACAVAALVVWEMDANSGKEALALVRAARPNAVATPSMEAYLESL